VKSPKFTDAIEDKPEKYFWRKVSERILEGYEPNSIKK